MKIQSGESINLTHDRLEAIPITRTSLTQFSRHEVDRGEL